MDRSALLLAVLLAAVPGGATAQVQAQAERTLICRGGGAMRVDLAPGQGQAGTTVEFHFIRAPDGADRRPPGSGECAWSDGPLGEAAPESARLTAPGVATSVQFAGGGRITRFGFQGEAADLDRLLEALRTSVLLRLKVREEDGRFLVDQVLSPPGP